MDFNHVRKGVTQAKFNEDFGKFLFGEISTVAIVIGLMFRSWWAFGIILVILTFGLRIRMFALILVVLLSIGWAIIGFFVGEAIESSGAEYVLCGLGFLIELGANLRGLQWTNDV